MNFFVKTDSKFVDKSDFEDFVHNIFFSKFDFFIILYVCMIILDIGWGFGFLCFDIKNIKRKSCKWGFGFSLHWYVCVLMYIVCMCVLIYMCVCVCVLVYKNGGRDRETEKEGGGDGRGKVG